MPGWHPANSLVSLGARWLAVALLCGARMWLIVRQPLINQTSAPRGRAHLKWDHHDRSLPSYDSSIFLLLMKYSGTDCFRGAQ